MKNKLNIKILLVSIGLLMACSKSFIELEPATEFTNEVALASMEKLQDALVGAYGPLEKEGCFGEDFQGVPGAAADNVKKSLYKSSGRYAEWYAFSSTSSSTVVETWADIYQCIARANNVINAHPEADTGDVSVAQVDQILGEALFLRAFCHFQLVNFFAQDYNFVAGGEHPGIPIVLVTEIGEPARNTVAEVYTQVIADLEQAASLMSLEAQSIVYYATVDAANALLSRVYLYQGDYAKAAAKASLVLNSTNGYKLYTTNNYLDVWELDGTSESIFELAMSSTDPNFPNRGNTIGNLFSEDFYGDLIVTEDFYNLATSDPDDIRGKLLYEDANGEYRHKKFPGKASQNTPEVNNARVIRLSEMYLNRAEAYFETGNTASALADINTLRANRGLAAIAPVDFDADAIERERRIELAFEGHRLFDLKRKQQDVVRVDCHLTSNCTVPAGSYLFAFPIPETEMAVNSNMVQNAGY